ncbi:MAG: cytidylate kinase-like family protein [Lachnospiraceae bacterium]|nr:cytidylate kinase-like family protein [Lachnospiraceae bacterium]
MIITISRKTGSGGHTIGKLLAEKLGYDFYDKEIVAAAAKEMGIDEKLIMENGENMSEQDYIDMKSGFIPYFKKAEVPYEEIREAQDKVIHSIAERGNCVIVGRGADDILRERDDVFSIFIHAGMEYRIERVRRHEGKTSQEERIRKELERKDRSRAMYYRYFTQKEWGKAENYFLCLDAGIFTKTQCTDLIIQAVGMKKRCCSDKT